MGQFVAVDRPRRVRVREGYGMVVETMRRQRRAGYGACARVLGWGHIEAVGAENRALPDAELIGDTLCRLYRPAIVTGLYNGKPVRPSAPLLLLRLPVQFPDQVCPGPTPNCSAITSAVFTKCSQ